MAEFDPRNPYSRPTTPPITAWFEYLLDDGLLEKNLNKEDPEVSAESLLAQFLHQAKVSLESDKAANEDTKKADDGDKKETITKKTQALQLLAFKVAAHIQWKLKAMETSLPLRMVHGLLLDLWCTVQQGITVEMSQQHGSPVVQGTLDHLPEVALFALQLYHRWYVRTFIMETFPKKIAKTANVQVPGLTDPTALLNGGSKDGLSQLGQGDIIESEKVLKDLLAVKREWHIPTMQCFGKLDENINTVSHDWSNAPVVSTQLMHCQIAYDVGCLSFHQHDFVTANQMFTLSAELYKQVDVSICDIDSARLEGYCLACSKLSAQSAKLALPTDFVDTRHIYYPQKFQGLVDKLIEDNSSQKLSLVYRESVEEDIMLSDLEVTQQSPENLAAKETLISQVKTCNIVRAVMDNKMAPSQYLATLKTGETENLDFLLKVCGCAFKDCSQPQRVLLKNFLRYLCLTLPTESKLIEKLFGSDIRAYFDTADMEQFGQVLQHKLSTLTKHSVQLPQSSQKEEGVIERQLLITFDPATIKSLVHKLKGTLSKQQIFGLSDEWHLPREIQVCIQSLAIELEQIYTYVLLAKSRQCIRLKQFATARELVNACESLIKDHSYKLSRLLRWEVLLADLTMHQEKGILAPDVTLQELGKRARSCIGAVRTGDRDLRPGVDVLEGCAAFLLNTEDYDYLIGHNEPPNGFVQLARLLAALSKQLPAIKAARAPARDLWEALILIFTSSVHQKRTSTGAMSMLQRDSNLGVLNQNDFLEFLERIKNPVTLSALQSCLTKLYNILKDDISFDISSEYSMLWPTTVNSSGSLNVGAVTESMRVAMRQSLATNPNQPSWLKTQADICFAHDQYTQAMKHYLEAGAVTTDFFAEPPPKSVLDDQVYKRMIKCCSYLQCHTQVAVLSQFLDEVDYGTAFKALQERTCTDAMDQLYHCLWDTTLLEYIINLHTKRGEFEKRNIAMGIMGLAEINGSNPPEILIEVANSRKTRFLQILAQQYLT